MLVLTQEGTAIYKKELGLPRQKRPCSTRIVETLRTSASKEQWKNRAEGSKRQKSRRLLIGCHSYTPLDFFTP